MVNGTYYTEQNPITLLYSTQTITYATVSFPDLIMTQLAPGEEVFMVASGLDMILIEAVDPNCQSSFVNCHWRIYVWTPFHVTNCSLTVGQNAVTNPTTSSASSYTTTTSPDPNNVSYPYYISNRKVGPIVGGVVGTIAGLVFLALLGWLFVMHRRRQNSHATDPLNYHPTYPNDKGINYSGPTEMFHQPQYQGGESDDHEAMSGRLRYN